MKRPLVITVASEKGGVGKTTIATNLAVYLKALREDLPVTIASFDNNFSVDQMFALGSRPENNVAGLLGGESFADLVTLGQYGVQYIASARRMQQPGHEPEWLGKRFADLDASGIFILDTRPILDWFSEAALLAADIVLVPIKDRAALINADALRQILTRAGRADRLWLLPSLVDTRARLNAEVRVHEFLTYAAREREYQVLDIQISKSPKVEGLASGFSSCIRPVLTHARNTAVHGQLRQLAEFILRKLDSAPERGAALDNTTSENQNNLFLTSKRNLAECTVCARQFGAGQGYFFFDMGSRRRGHLHVECYRQIIEELGFVDSLVDDGAVAFVFNGPGLVDLDNQFTAYSCDGKGQILEVSELRLDEFPSLKATLEMMTGKSLDEAYREIVLLNCSRRVFKNGNVDQLFTEKRKQIVREIHTAGLF